MDSLWERIIELASKKVPNIVGTQESYGRRGACGRTANGTAWVLV